MKIKRYSKKNDYSFCFGPELVSELLEAKKEKVMKILFMKEGLRDENVKKIMVLAKKEGIPFEINDRLIKKISSKGNTYVVGIFEKYICELDKKANNIVLVNPTNPGNLGTIMRTIVAFGMEDLVLIKPAVDIFQPSCVRASMGSIFYTNFKYFDSFEDYLNTFQKRNIYSFMLDGEKEIAEIKFKEPFSLVFGNESQGLGQEFKKYGETAFIPHSDFVESLNLSMSVGIALYVACK